MKELFEDILSLDDIHGVMLFSSSGDVLYKEFIFPPNEEPESKSWWPDFASALNNLQEIDLIYDNLRLYIRQVEVGFLFVVMGLFAPSAKLRLTCDLLVPQLQKSELEKKKKGLFRRK